MLKRKLIPTSLEAYNSLQPTQLAEIYEKILWGLGQIKEGTFEDLSVCLRIPKEKIWKRLNELAKANLIYRPGNTKVLSSGRKGYTWRLVEKEGQPEKVTESALPGKSVGDFSRNLIQNKLF
jgi:predicted transcriptional regulator